PTLSLHDALPIYAGQHVLLFHNVSPSCHFVLHGRADPCEVSVIFSAALEQQRGEAVDYWMIPVLEAACSVRASIHESRGKAAAFRSQFVLGQGWGRKNQA